MRRLAPVTGASSCHLAIPLFLLAAGFLHAEQLPIKAYTSAEGLAHNHINRIRQDSRGYLWFCTDGGLSRFDGYEFTNYTTDDGLPHPWVNDLLETRDGAYWVATDGGVCRFNPNGTRRRQAADGGSADVAEPMFQVYHPSSGADASRVNALAEDPSGGIWCATYAGLCRLQQAGGKPVFEFVDIGLPRNVYEGTLINNLAFDRNGTLWIAARYGLFRRLPGGKAERYTTAHGLPDDFIETMFQDREGRWWIGTRSRGFCSIVAKPEPGRPVTARCYTTSDGLPQNDVRSIFQSSLGTLWVGTVGGLSEFEPRASSFRNYTTANGLSGAVIYKMGEDRNGNLWIGTRDNGVMKLAGNGFVTYSAQDGFLGGNADASIFECLNGELCVITAVGPHTLIERFDGDRFIATEITLPVPKGLSTAWLRPGTFQDKWGDWWVATIGGLYRFPKTTRAEDLKGVQPRLIYDVSHGLLGPSLNHIYHETRGDVWMATGSFSGTETHLADDLVRWERSTSKLRHTTVPDGLLPLNVHAATALGEDASGNLWIGFDQGAGLVRYRAGRFEEFQPGREAFKGEIRAIFLDHIGRLWIASTQAGLSRIDDPTSDHPHLARYTTEEGLSSNEIRCITEDRFGRIYVGTTRGVDRIDPTAAHVVGMEPSQVRHYTWTDGLAKGTVQFAFRDRHDALWFLTNDGMSRFVPAPDPAPVPPPILITGLKIMGVPQPLSQLGETKLAIADLPPSHNEVEIEFLGLDFREDADFRYQYLLQGADGHWSAPTDQRRVIYPSLTPGKYRFLVRAVTADGGASSQPAIAAFTVLAPVWKRWWFVSLEVALAALVIYSLYRYRVEQLLAVERIRTRIATDLHDDIGSSLTQVAILSEVVRRRIGESDAEINGPLSRIASVSRELVDSMSDIVWAINPAKDKLSYLEQRMREFAADLFTAGDVRFQFHSSEDEYDLPVGADVRRQVFLVFKECLHNVVRHAHCTQVDVEVRVENKRVIVQVRDNGVGFEPFAAVDGHGLASMRERAKLVGGTIGVTAHQGGTAVTLEVPIANVTASGGIPPEWPT
jgi:signal transduction histidine kinase/ligand-binding sensor domain-containing protein